MTDSIIDGGTFRMDWKSGKMVRCEEHPELPKGTLIHSYGFAGSYARYAMTGEGNQCVRMDENYEGAYFGPFQTVDKYSEPIANLYGIGLYYDLEAPRFSDEEIAAAIERGNAFLAEKKAKEEAEAKAFAKAEDEARRTYSDLYEQKPDKGYADAAFVAKNIRKGLAAKFPGQKFSVRKDGYDSIRVSWTDGPTEAEVEAVAGLFREDSKRDPYNDDLWDYSDTAFTTVFGGVRYMWINREISEERVAPLAAEIVADCPALADGKDIHRNDIYDAEGAAKVLRRLDESGCEYYNVYWFTAAGIAHMLLSNKSFYEAPAKKVAKASTEAVKEAQEGGNGLSYVDYSDKAFAVTGETRPLAETLKELGGRFNARLSCGPGWIFSKKKEAEVRAALSL